MNKNIDIVCPTCGKKGKWTTENEFRPFCSHRCKLIDLGEWADEKHRIPDFKTPLPDDDTDQS